VASLEQRRRPRSLSERRCPRGALPPAWVRGGGQSRTPRRWRDAGAHPIVQLGPGWLRHSRGTAYRCFLPDLTGFTDPGCVGPDRQRRGGRSRPNATPPRWGIRPRCSGLRVQGTANAPSSATEVIVRARQAGQSGAGMGGAPPRRRPRSPSHPRRPRPMPARAGSRGSAMMRATSKMGAASKRRQLTPRDLSATSAGA